MKSASVATDKIVALILLLGSMVISLVGLISGSRIAFLGLIGAGIPTGYLVLRNRSWPEETNEATRAFMMATTSLVFVSLSISALFLRSGADMYQRSIAHFATAALAFGLLAVQAVIRHRNSRSEVLVLLELAIVCFWVRLSPQLLFPSVIGIDSWFHIGVVSEISQTGLVPANNVYSGLTQFHIFSAVLAEVTGFRSLAAIELVGPLVGTLGSAFVYLLGRSLFGARAGLAAAVCYGFYGYIVSMDFSFLAFAMGATLLLMTLYLIVKYLRTKSPTGVAIVVLSTFALINTHTVMALTLLVVLGTTWIVNRLSSIGRDRESGAIPVSAAFLALLSVPLFAWWAFISGSLTDFASILRWGLQYEQFSLTPTSNAYLASIPLVEYLLNFSGLVGVGTLALLGTLSLFSKERVRQNLGVVAGIWVVGLLGLTSFSPQLSTLLGLRWILGFQLLSSPIAGLGLLWLYGRSTRRAIGAMIVIFMVTAVAFANITAPGANYDTSIYSPNTQFRLGFTYSEFVSLSDIGALNASSLSVVYPEFYFYRNYMHLLATDIGPHLVDRSFGSEPKGLIVLRTSIRSSPVYYTQTVTRLDYDPIFDLSQQYDLVYDSGSVVAFANG